MKYRKTALIEAEQFDGSNEMIEKYDIAEIPQTDNTDKPWKCFIFTLEGNVELNINDWIATGINGEHWPIADDIFKKTYEAVKFGCKYCQPNTVLMRTYSGDITVVGNKLIEEIFWDDYNDCPSGKVMVSEIRYCPMCGKKLEKE